MNISQLRSKSQTKPSANSPAPTNLVQVMPIQSNQIYKLKKSSQSMLVSTMAAMSLAMLGVSLTGCGFQLRGYQTPNSINANFNQAPATQLVLGDSLQDITVKNALKRELDQLGINTVEDNSISNAKIEVTEIRLRTYQLRGLLTEIRMVMTADVVYHTQKNGQSAITNNQIQVERSYQFDQATTATDNPQADQIQAWLYANLAQRIADQYVALQLTP